MNSIPRIVASFLLILAASGAVNSQDLVGRWTRVESADKDFSVVLPENFFVTFDKKGFVVRNQANPWGFFSYENVRSLSSYRDGMAIFLEVYDVRDGKKGITNLTGDSGLPGYQDLTFENIEIRKVSLKKTEYSMRVYFAFEKTIYLLGLSSREGDIAKFNRILATVRLKGKPVFSTSSNAMEEPGNSVSLAEATETEVKFVNGRPDKKQQNPEPDDIDKKKKYDKKIIILELPSARKLNPTIANIERGTVRLRITFLPNGHIGEIESLKYSDGSQLRRAIDSARRIKFIPPEINGAPVEVKISFDYGFNGIL